MDNIRTVLIDMPCSVKAYTLCQDDYYTIVINSGLNYEQRQKAYNHEMSHINNQDFSKNLSVGMIELIAHQI